MEGNRAGGGWAADAGKEPSPKRAGGAAEPKISVRRSCDFCRKRRRHCDGDRRRRCSFCIAKNQPDCHYSLRAARRPNSTFKASTSRRRRDRVPNASSPLPPAGGGGLSSRRANKEKGVGKERQSAAVGSGGGSGGGTAASVSLPHKRCRFSASPATGLIGQQENGFLDDFFGCLGFLSLANESTIRKAMVCIMVAVGTHYSERPPAVTAVTTAATSATVAPAHGDEIEHIGRSRATAGAEEGDGVREAQARGAPTEGCWGEAIVTAMAGGKQLPSDASTCLLWCAIALGALVRGCPLATVERYYHLAHGSLMSVSADVATLERARAYIAMVFLHNFLGNQRKSHECLKNANDIVNKLPPVTLPVGINEVLRYAGKAWVFERELASAEEISGYWENASPIWQLSESVVEHDVSGFIISVDICVDQTMLEERGAARVFLAEETQPPGSQPVASYSPGGYAAMGVQEEKLAGSARGDALATGKHKEALPEMLRLGNYLERSKMRPGLGGLVYYMRLGFLQFVNNQITASVDSFRRALSTILRYPGVCRYSCWAHFAHSQLWCLAFGPDRERYEELRAAYNPVRPAGCPPAPPFEEWRGMSDICDHAYCRRVSTQCSHVSDSLA
eukprot:g5945.t1